MMGFVNGLAIVIFLSQLNLFKEKINGVPQWLQGNELLIMIGLVALTMLIMCASVFIFSVSSYNIFFLLQANFRFIAEYGMTALMDGALVQLLELTGLSLVSATFYIIFRACEKVLVTKVLD